MATILVARVADLPQGQARALRAGGLSLLVVPLEGSFHVLENRCPHAGAALSEGPLEGCRITCPWHGSQFDVCAGSVLRGPATAPPERYPARVEDGWLLIEA